MMRAVARGPAFWLLLPGLFFEAFNALRVTGAVTLGDALILASGAFVIVDSIRGRTRIWLPWWLLLGLPLFAAGPFVAALTIGAVLRDDVVYAATLVFCMFIVPPIIASQRQQPGSPGLLLLAWVCGHLVGALIAWLQFHHWDPAFLRRWLYWLGDRIAGMNSNPNILGESLALVTPVLVALAAGTNSWVRGAIWAAACAFVVYVADLTGSRAAVAGGIGGGLVVAWLFLFRTQIADVPLRVGQLGALTLAVGLWFLLRTPYYDSAIERLLGHSQTGALSNWIRSQLAEAGLRAFGNAPFLGTGYGWLTYKAHNVPLVLLQCGGLFGLAGFLCTIAGFGRCAVRTLSASRTGVIAPTWALGLAGVWAAFVVLCMFQFPILHRHAYILFGLSVLWWSVATRQRRPPTEPADAPSWPPRERVVHAR